MFTGIIQALGRVSALDARGAGLRLSIATGGLDLADVALGDSIAVNGVCLSVVELRGDGFSADVSQETLSCTTLGVCKTGEAVNLEKALLPTTRLGGHLVSGHVDGIGRVEEVRPAGECRVLRISVPPALGRYLAAKGSVCVDGVSLTVNAVGDADFEINIIPHTLVHTVIAAYRRGSAVNIEVDVVARYLERLLRGDADGAKRIDRGFLTAHGFIKNAQDH